jgi:uncharacterized protein YuzE
MRDWTTTVLEYDSSVDCAYLFFKAESGEWKIDHTNAMSIEINFDISVDGKVLGMELIGDGQLGKALGVE